MIKINMLFHCVFFHHTLQINKYILMFLHWSLFLNKVGCKALMLAKNFKSSEYLKMMLSLVPELRISKKGKLKTKNLPQLNHVILMDEVDESYSGVWMFEEIFNLGGDKEKQKLIESAAT